MTELDSMRATTLADPSPEELRGLVAQFLSAGFLVFPGMLEADRVGRFVEILERLDREVTSSVGGAKRAAGDPFEVRNFIGMVPEAVELAIDPRIVLLVSALMGYNIQVHTSHAFIKPPFPRGTSLREQRGIDWHFDMSGAAGPVNGRIPWIYTRVGFFLTDLLEPEAGSIKVVPGSHLVAGRPPSPPDSPEPFGAIELLIPAGSVVFLDQRLWHATVPNFSVRSRMNIYFGYSWRWIRPMDYRNYPRSLLDRCDPVGRQLLGEAVTDLGYVFPEEVDVPLRGWCAARGLTDLPAVTGFRAG